MKITNIQSLDYTEINKLVVAIANNYCESYNDFYLITEGSFIDYNTGKAKKVIKKHRFFIKNNMICVYKNRARNYGYELKLKAYDSIEIVPKKIKTKSEKQTWVKSWQKAINMLEKSGLWPEALADYKRGVAIGYDKIKEAYKASWGHYSDDYQENNKKRVEAVKAIDERLVYTLDDGNEYFDTSILWYMDGPAKIKKMRFGKSDAYQNQYQLDQIKKAIQNKTPYRSGTIKVNYDVSFSYDPELNKAWYSEEYRGCGNGHYYLALNETHAIYYEKD